MTLVSLGVIVPFTTSVVTFRNGISVVVSLLFFVSVFPFLVTSTLA